MKTSALTVGALTLLSQGIALASGESGSNPLMWLEYEEKSTASDVSGTGSGDNAFEAATEMGLQAWDSIEGEPLHYFSFGNCEVYKALEINCSSGLYVENNGNGAFTTVWGGPVTIRKYHNRQI